MIRYQNYRITIDFVYLYSFNRNECEVGAVDTGSKCWTHHFFEDYILDNQDVSWENAKVFCSKMNARLVSLPTDKEYSFFIANLKATNFKGLVYIGASTMSLNDRSYSISKMYRHVHRWEDCRSNFYVSPNVVAQEHPNCFHYINHLAYHFDGISALNCYSSTLEDNTKGSFMCETEKIYIFKTAKKLNYSVLSNLPEVLYKQPKETNFGFKKDRFTKCTDGHLVWEFMSCEEECNSLSATVEDCVVKYVKVPMFKCIITGEFIHYTFVCDGEAQCKDLTDERDCIYEKCPFYTFQCASKECIDIAYVCDTEHQCYSLDDEFCQDTVDYYFITVSLLDSPLMTDLSSSRVIDYNDIFI